MPVDTMIMPTPISLSHTRPPRVPDFILEPEWRWPAHKFGLRQADLFTTLLPRFNTVAVALQTPKAFHFDVCEAAAAAPENDLAALYSLLDERRTQRLQEERDAWRSITQIAAGRPQNMAFASNHDTDPDAWAGRWAALLSFSREFSLDELVRFVDALRILSDTKDQIKANSPCDGSMTLPSQIPKNTDKQDPLQSTPANVFGPPGLEPILPSPTSQSLKESSTAPKPATRFHTTPSRPVTRSQTKTSSEPMATVKSVMDSRVKKNTKASSRSATSGLPTTALKKPHRTCTTKSRPKTHH